MILSPLEQFQIIPFIEFCILNVDFSITNFLIFSLTILINITFITFLNTAKNNKLFIVPDYWQYLKEFVVICLIVGGVLCIKYLCGMPFCLTNLVIIPLTMFICFMNTTRKAIFKNFYSTPDPDKKESELKKPSLYIIFKTLLFGSFNILFYCIVVILDLIIDIRTFLLRY